MIGKNIIMFYLPKYFFTGWTYGNSPTAIISINCSKFVNNLEDTFYPYKLNGSETQIDYCTKCLCDKVCTLHIHLQVIVILISLGYK